MAFPSSPVLAFTRAASEQEARLLASKVVGPEHVFLALLWPEATSEPTIMGAWGITLQRARVAMHELAVWGGEPLKGALPVALESERAYEIAERYAEGQRVRHADMVIGVLSVRSGPLEHLLLKLGTSRSRLRMAVQQTEAKRQSSRARSTETQRRVSDSGVSNGGVSNGGVSNLSVPPSAPSQASSAPDVVDLRATTPRSTIDVPGNIEPLSLFERVEALSTRVDLLTAQVKRLLCASDGGPQ